MSSSSSMGGSLALAAATAMAVSGSLVIFSLCRAARHAHDHDAPAPPSSSEQPSLRPCLSSSGGKPRRKGAKRVRFAEGVVDNEGTTRAARSLPAAAEAGPTCRGAAERMPANREALYRGMLRDRSVHRVAYSY